MRGNLAKFLSILAVVFLIVMMNVMTPSEAGPFGVLVFFTLMYFVAFNLSGVILRALYKLMGRKGWLKKDILYAVVLAFAPILLLFMQSFSAVTILTIGLVAFFEFLALFLVSKKF